MKQDATILVCCHKDDYFYNGENFLPIHVGKAISNININIQGDDTGNSISTRNPNYCELTAHYWYWKNCKHSKYVGLNHYRRYFDFKSRLPYGSSYTIFPEVNSDTFSLAIPNLDSMFRDTDIILPKRIVYPFSLTDDYKFCHISDDLEIMKQVVSELYPDYLPAYTDVMDKNNQLAHYNMFITTRDVFNEYSNWLFNILFEVEQRVKVSGYPVQARIFGYMSERLLNVYVHHNKLNIKYLPVIKIASEPQPSKLRNFMRAIRNHLSFIIYLRRSLGYK